MEHASYGQAYSTDEVRDAIENSGASGQFIDSEDELVDMAVDRMANGKVIGWFQG